MSKRPNFKLNGESQRHEARRRREQLRKQQKEAEEAEEKEQAEMKLAQHADEKCSFCLDTPEDPVWCGKCRHQFCKECALAWKVSQNKCPFKCSNDAWEISINVEEEVCKMNADGYTCPRCNRQGYTKCCRKLVPFSILDEMSPGTICYDCNDATLALFTGNCQECKLDGPRSMAHQSIFYYFCISCSKKFCCPK